VGRDGQVLSSLFLGLTPFSSLASTADIGHEGVTIDGAGNIYIVNEAGGGSLSVPQLWVYAPSQPIPEPGTFALMAFGLAGLVLRRRQPA
jgi:PEP-CTERM motif